MHPVLGLLTGHIDLASAAEMGVEYDGEIGAVERMLPDAPPAA